MKRRRRVGPVTVTKDGATRVLQPAYFRRLKHASDERRIHDASARLREELNRSLQAGTRVTVPRFHAALVWTLTDIQEGVACVQTTIFGQNVTQQFPIGEVQEIGTAVAPVL